LRCRRRPRWLENTLLRSLLVAATVAVTALAAPAVALAAPAAAEPPAATEEAATEPPATTPSGEGAKPAADPAPAETEPFQRDETPLPEGVVEETQGDDTKTESSGGSLVRMIAGLAIVLAVIYGVYWLLKSYRKSKLGASDGRIEIVATTPLGPNRSVHLIRVGEEFLLVGSAEHGVTKLRAYSAREAAELAPLIESAATARRFAPGSKADGRRTLAQSIDDLRWRTVRK
jgi:flagellar biosynthetic protein FliO